MVASGIRNHRWISAAYFCERKPVARKQLIALLAPPLYHVAKLWSVYTMLELVRNTFFSCYNSSCGGVLILSNNNFEHKVEKVKSDPNGNYIILDINIDGKKFTLVNLYGPNDDKPKFYKELMQGYKSFNNDNIIMCGDWNLVINPDLDTNNYLHINNPRARQEVLNSIEEEGFFWYL